MLAQVWLDTFVQSLQNLWLAFTGFIPSLFWAFVVFLVGWILAAVLSKAVMRVLETVQVDRLFDQLGIMKYLHDAGVSWEFSSIVGSLVRWFFIIAAFLAAVDILGLAELSGFITDILLYIPNIIVAAFILLVAAILASFLERVVTASMKATDMGPVKFVGVVIRWSIWGFAILAALSQLGVATALVQTLFTGFVAMLALAGGLAFGLGGQGVAKDVLERIRRDVSE